MNLREQRAAAFKAAKDIHDTANRAGYEKFTPDQQAKFDEHIAEVKALDVRIKSATETKAKMDKLGSLGPDQAAPGVHSRSLFSREEAAGFVNAARSKTSFGVTVKAAILGGVLLPTSGNLVSPQAPGLGAYPLRSLFTQAEAAGPTVRYYQIGAGTSAVVAEGAAKPDAGVTTVPVDAALLKVAGTFQISDELEEDAAFLVSAIEQEVIRSVMVKENELIVSALTGASGVFTGTGTAATALDVVATAIGAAEARDGITPGALVVNPVDLATMRKAKASTAGSYYIDPLAAAPSAVHGVRLVSTGAVAAGTMLLVSEGAGVMYSRGGVRVEAGYNGDDWSKNLQTIRVEARILPAIVRPGLVTELTLT